MQRPDPRAFRQYLHTLASPNLRPGGTAKEQGDIWRGAVWSGLGGLCVSWGSPSTGGRWRARSSVP